MVLIGPHGIYWAEFGITMLLTERTNFDKYKVKGWSSCWKKSEKHMKSGVDNEHKVF